MMIPSFKFQTAIQTPGENNHNYIPVPTLHALYMNYIITGGSNTLTEVINEK